MSKCKICNVPGQLVNAELGGYKQGTYYDIYYCENCNASYAEPLEIDEELYDIIYSQAKYLPGYDRYYRFADDVLKVADPLFYLAEMEDTYWAIYDFLRNYTQVKSPRILEVGCGLGYLTYSLVKSGFNAKGVDISENAVVEATNRYGKFYERADIYQYSKIKQEKFDIIILTEVIEHIPNPIQFVEALKSLLSKDGCIIITTPNKSEAISQEKYWDTELPPVHLWWLSEKSFKNISKILGMSVSFTDFTKFQNRILFKRKYQEPWRKQTLDVSGKILFTTPFSQLKYVTKRQLINIGLWQVIKKTINGTQKTNNLSVSDRLCAILKPINE
jgi:SAM-dependent methyltransferase